MNKSIQIISPQFIHWLESQGFLAEEYQLRDNCFETHYWAVALYHKLRNGARESISIDDSADMGWLTRDDILRNGRVHSYAREYFRENPRNKLPVLNQLLTLP